MFAENKRRIVEAKLNAFLLFLLFSCFFLIFSEGVFGAVLYVAGDAANSGHGRSWPDAFKTIQEAVDAADEATDDEIWVKQGTYLLSAQIDVDRAVRIYGGFAGWETERDQRKWETNVTTRQRDV